MITGSDLYNFVQCPHRVTLDCHESADQRDEANPFVELLWEQGVGHEVEVVTTLTVSLDLSRISYDSRAIETINAMRRGESLIYGGRIEAGDMVGVPDLLERRGNGYMPGDIKSGSGIEGDDEDGKLKRHYAFQLAHYVHILASMGFGDGTYDAFVIDRHVRRIPYVLSEPQGVRNTQSWWDSYQQALVEVRALVNRTSQSVGALAAACKLCHWHSHCKQALVASNDLTLIAELGRAKRDAMAGEIPTVASLAACDPSRFFRGKKTQFDGIGPDTLVKFYKRALLLSAPEATPYLKKAIRLPVAEREVYFDIEADPMRDVVYLHGFVERMHGRPETAKFISFFANSSSATDEESGFRNAWAYLRARVADSTIYYYSPYERTAYKKLAEKYSAVCSVADVETLFNLDAMIDLYHDVVRSSTEWPTYDQSIKTLAQYLGFQWRDTHPSGAASIEWYHRWIETGDETIKRRILEYNEDDCFATGVVVDGVRQMSLANG